MDDGVGKSAAFCAGGGWGGCVSGEWVGGLGGGGEEEYDGEGGYGRVFV